MPALLRVEGMSITYPGVDHPAVSHLSFTLEPGRCLALVGETGSGKTSSLMAAVGLLESATVAADLIQFDGRDLLSRSPSEMRDLRRTRIGMVFQDPVASWNPTRTIAAQLLPPRRRTRQPLLDRLVTLCRRVGIREPEQRLHAYPHQLSGGMLQRFMIAGALLQDPVLLVADEPTSALDASVQAELLDLLDELCRERALAMLLVSHDLGVVGRIADDVMVLFRGAVVERGTVDQVIDHPTHPYTRSLLASTIGMTGPRKTRIDVDRNWIADEAAAHG
jgi:peptide/nickel transport system ATP-binding protein